MPNIFVCAFFPSKILFSEASLHVFSYLLTELFVLMLSLRVLYIFYILVPTGGEENRRKGEREEGRKNDQTNYGYFQRNYLEGNYFLVHKFDDVLLKSINIAFWGGGEW